MVTVNSITTSYATVNNVTYARRLFTGGMFSLRSLGLYIVYCSFGGYGMAITAQMVTAYILVKFLNESPNFGSATRYAAEIFCQWGQSA